MGARRGCGYGSTCSALHALGGAWLVELAPAQAARLLPPWSGAVTRGEAMIDTIVAYLKGRKLERAAVALEQR